ncbi:MAG: 1-acyl-sn-glycerol-3-phosphate acyltransferase [Desulfomonilia bacterium]
MKKHHDTFPFTFEGSYGVLLHPFLKRLFSHINIPELYRESILALSREGHLIFAQSSESLIDTLLLNYRLKHEGLPFPRVIFGKFLVLFQPISRTLSFLKTLLSGNPSPFDEGFYRQFMDDPASASLVFLDKEPGPSYRDPILELLKVQRETDRPLYIVPQRIIYRRAPLKVKDVSKEEQATIQGFRKLITLAQAQENGFIEHGEPINLKDELQKALAGSKFLEEVAQDIRNELMHRLAELGSNISGAPVRERSFIIDKTVRDPMLQSFIKAHSIEHGKSVGDIERTIYKHLDQIASDLNPAIINLMNRSLTWVFNNIYDGIDVNAEGLKAVKETARKGSLVYVPCHKSHIDYLILSYFLFQNWMSVPVIAAGINLAFFPMGSILRRGGAFFMKRTFRNNPIYAQTFAAYVRTILGERIPMEFFIEGTRSRSGKLMLPKKGLLSMIIQGWESGVSRDVIFVPVYVGYDTVVEENVYIREMKGEPKQKESFLQLLKAGSILKNRYGKVYIRFAPPISLNEYMKGKTYSKMKDQQREALFDDVAREIISKIYQQTVATPFSLLACVLTSSTSALEEMDLKKGFETFLKYLKHFEYNLAFSFSDEEEAFRDAFENLKTKGLVSIDEGETEDDPDLISVQNENRIHLEYYKNTILNFFVPASLIANVLLKQEHGGVEKDFHAQVESLATLLENEFILDMECIGKAFDFMKESGFVTVTKGVYTVNPHARDQLKFFDGLIENYLESYLCVARHVTKVKKPQDKDLLKIINRYAQRMLKKGEIKRPEALCLPVYKGALDTFKMKGILDDQNRVIDEGALKRVTNEIEEYLQE